MKTKTIPCTKCKDDTYFDELKCCTICGGHFDNVAEHELLAYGITFAAYKESQEFAKYIDENYGYSSK